MADRNSMIDTAKPRAPNIDAAPKPASIGTDLFRGVLVSLEARLGQATLTIDEITALRTGSVVTLDTSLADHVDLYLNDVRVARGEIVAVGENFGVRIVEIAPKP